MRKNARKSGAKAAPTAHAERIDVLAELAALKAMTVPELQEKWQAIFGERARNAGCGNLKVWLFYRVQDWPMLGCAARHTARSVPSLDASRPRAYRSSATASRGSLRSRCRRSPAATSGG